MYVGSIYSVTKRMKSYVQEIELEAMLSGTEPDSEINITCFLQSLEKDVKVGGRYLLDCKEEGDQLEGEERGQLV